MTRIVCPACDGERYIDASGPDHIGPFVGRVVYIDYIRHVACERCDGEGEIECTAEHHEELRDSATTFATLSFIGCSPWELNGRPVVVLHANCGCKGTVARIVDADSDEAAHYLALNAEALAKRDAMQKKIDALLERRAAQ